MRNFDFIGHSKKFFTFSIIMIVGIFLCTAIFGLQLDIQFKGGSIVTYSYEGEMDVPAFESLVQEITEQDVSFRSSKEVSTGRETIIVTMPGTESLNAEQSLMLTQTLQEKFATNLIETVSISNVDPTIGKEFLAKSIVAVVLASILMVVFVGIRFRKIGGLSAGVTAVVALLHDITIVFGVFVIFGFPINDNFIAVILTILGYSLNDTIVIYDRVRENKRLLGIKVGVAELVNTSINQSFIRSINTSVTTIMAMVIVTIVAYMYNVTSIITFALPMIVGLVFGAYSSICIAGPLWVKWQQNALTKITKKA